MRYKRHWLALALVAILSFAVLLSQGVKLHRELPPIPDRVTDTSGAVLLEGETIRQGQNVWQSLGGQQVGSIWGHGAYVAPDWSADWLHREAMFVLDTWARAEGGASFDALNSERRAALSARLAEMMRKNTFDPASGALTLDPIRVQAFEANAAHYADVFSKGRDAYAIPEGALTDPVKLRAVASFFFWTSWVASTNRPGDSVTYTQNWPHEPLVANTPVKGSLLWSMASVVFLLAGIGALVTLSLIHI